MKKVRGTKESLAQEKLGKTNSHFLHQDEIIPMVIEYFGTHRAGAIKFYKEYMEDKNWTDKEQVFKTLDIWMEEGDLDNIPGEEKKNTKKDKKNKKDNKKKNIKKEEDEDEDDEEEEKPKKEKKTGKKGSGLVPKTKTTIPDEIFNKLPENIQGFIKENLETGSKASRRNLRKLGFKLSDPDTWNGFIKEEKKTSKKNKK